ncbi:hypothetical protein ACWDUL_02405 [Nocardia niigatensis]|nr:hypothetical protein [Nocardia niigatensis]
MTTSEIDVDEGFAGERRGELRVPCSRHGQYRNPYLTHCQLV